MASGAPVPRKETLTERVRKAFVSVPEVEEKRMFGSVAFMVRGKMCVTARAERIMCRIDPALHERAIEHPGCETVRMRGREYRGYVFVRAESVATNRALKHWLDLALNYNRRVSIEEKTSRAARTTAPKRRASRGPS